MCKRGDTVKIWLPSWPNHPNGKWVGVDRCIAPRVKELRAHGIQTLASCCGHGKSETAEVSIDDRDVDRARALGYQVEFRGRPDYDDFYVVVFDYQELQMALMEAIGKEER